MKDEYIKRIIRKHYNQPDDNLFFQLMLRVCREIAEISVHHATQHEDNYQTSILSRLNRLEKDVAILQGEEFTDE
jgi:hypothetical protein